MNTNSEHHYRVFLSYAHADAQTDASKELIASFKEQINAALQSAAGNDLVFLDSEALEWGDEWSSKIMECLQQCKVFVCLLSPNYQKSSYCKRERLMWERKEIRLGRLRKGTHPVYYIRIDNEKTEELLISQADDSKPFFENIEQIREGIIAEKIERVKKIAEKVKNKELVEEQASSVRYGFLHISPNFVGRLGELSELCEICSQNHIPIVTGEAGVGKSELAVAYASGYAERYQQGRFMLHMEGVEDWNHAVVKLVEDNSSAANSLKDLLELPEDYDKLTLEEKRKKAVQSLWKRSNDGRLLLILDNLDKLSLVSDNGLNKLLDGVGDLPKNVDIIATSRNNNLRRAGHVKALSGVVTDYNGLPVLYEIDNLDTASAFELFCRINNNQFPFAKCNPECMNDDVRKEYGALMEIISYLKGHAWSLEIIAALMAENKDDKYMFQCKLEEIQQTTTGIAGDDSSSNLSPALTPEQLLQPTFDRIAAMDHGCKIGVKIMELATVAAFFPPDMVSDEALLGYWKKYFVEFEKVGFDAGAFAIKQLHALHLINGDGDVSKMHRLTRDVLLERQSEEDKLTIVKQMQIYWDDFHSKCPNMNLQQVKPWIGWATEWLKRLPKLQYDEEFFRFINEIAVFGQEYFLYDDVEKLLLQAMKYTTNLTNSNIYPLLLLNLADLHRNINNTKEAEQEYNKLLSFYQRLSKKGNNQFECEIQILNSLSILHANLNNLEVAKQNIIDALSLLQKLMKSNINSLDFVLNKITMLNNLASINIRLNILDDAEYELGEALSIQRCIEKSKHEYFYAELAASFNLLAILNEKLNRTIKAEQAYKNALTIRRQLANNDHDCYNYILAETLNNLAIFYEHQGRFIEAEQNCTEALSIYRQLATRNKKHFEGDVAMTLGNLGNIHKYLHKYENAKQDFVEASSIYRSLKETNYKLFAPGLATILNNQASLYVEIGVNDNKDNVNVEQLLMEAYFIWCQFTHSNINQYNSELAKNLFNLAKIHRCTAQLDKAENECIEALKIFRKIAEENPSQFKSYVEKAEKLLDELKMK